MQICPLDVAVQRYSSYCCLAGKCHFSSPTETCLSGCKEQTLVHSRRHKELLVHLPSPYIVFPSTVCYLNLYLMQTLIMYFSFDNDTTVSKNYTLLVIY